MADKFTLSVGLAHELEHGMNRNGGWDGELVKLLCEGNNLGKVRDILLGRAQVSVVDHIVNGDADPFLPDGWNVEEHKKQGDMKITRDGDNLFVNGKKIEFFLSDKQQGNKVIEGNKLRKELADKPILNANVLDYLYEHLELIPESWKKDAGGNTRYIFFWGTVYRHSDGDLCVRCLCWCGGAWRWSDYWLDDSWFGYYPSAVLAS
ncbi:MAG: hypothetical protein M3Q73_03650 [bacterium]|nr:hypothetical protein [bacterium]